MAHPSAPGFRRCAAMIARSIEHEHHDVSLDDVWNQIAAGHAHLWEGEGGCAVTQVSVDDFAGPVVTLWIVSGDLSAILAMLPGCEAWARAWGVRESRFAPARPAWGRVLARNGYRDIGDGVFGKVLT